MTTFRIKRFSNDEKITVEYTKKDGSKGKNVYNSFEEYKNEQSKYHPELKSSTEKTVEKPLLSPKTKKNLKKAGKIAAISAVAGLGIYGANKAIKAYNRKKKEQAEKDIARDEWRNKLDL